jgi:hypothetical protein
MTDRLKGHALKAEDACVAYAIAHAEDKRLTKIIGASECARLAQWTVDMMSYKSEFPPQPNNCIADYWSFHLEGCAESYREVRNLTYDECCSACKVVLDTIKKRKGWRAKLGAAKRSILAIGRRLNAHKAEVRRLAGLDAVAAEQSIAERTGQWTQPLKHEL